MALVSAFLLAAALQVDRSQTLGYSYAEILRIGEHLDETSDWRDMALDT